MDTCKLRDQFFFLMIQSKKYKTKNIYFTISYYNNVVYVNRKGIGKKYTTHTYIFSVINQSMASKCSLKLEFLNFLLSN